MAKTCFLGSVTVAAPSTGSSPRSTTRWRAPGLFDFGDRTFVPVVREEARALATNRTTWHVPHVETLFVQRKISGTALLGARLKARVDVRGMAAKATGRPVDM